MTEITIILKDQTKFQSILEGSLLEVETPITAYFTRKLMSGVGDGGKLLSRSNLKAKNVDVITVRSGHKKNAPSVTREYLGFTLEAERKMYVLHLGEKKEFT